MDTAHDKAISSISSGESLSYDVIPVFSGDAELAPKGNRKRLREKLRKDAENKQRLLNRWKGKKRW